MAALHDLLTTYRNAALSEREKGTYFEELICTYLRNEATYRDLYSKVWTYTDWARDQGIDARDTGIDLVVQTHGTGEFHAIQCKFYAEDYKVQKADIDSFFTASGKKSFTHRLIVTTTNNWSEHANDALQNQHPPVSKIDLNDLENSQIDWAKYSPNQAPVLKEKKKLRDHQQTALAAVEHGLQTADRGKLIMACGTGKTFTSLKIAEKIAGAGKRVLFLVPSLSLLSQTLTEWTQESGISLHSFAVCSDSDVGHKRKKDDDVVQTFSHELRYPATTEPSRLAVEMLKRHDDQHMSVVFSTYHSIDVIAKAQHQHGLGEFDLIICDEAHRTTGATFGDDDESTFVKVHDADFICASKRLYMTATPRIYGASAKAKAETDSVALCSMDDASLYGKELYTISFSEAVRRQLLVDYKVIVLSIEESHVNRRLQQLLKDENNQLKVDDAAKIIGCWKALSKQGLSDDLTGDSHPMKRAVAFCQVIEIANAAKTHRVSSKQIAGMFHKVVEEYQRTEEFEHVAKLFCEAEHVDGSMNASAKEEKLNWLKADAPDDTCRILSNVRCLSEGVDVPALDAVLFLTPRNSQVDVVQSVGRVMRNAPGKKRGYVILPVVIPAGVEPHEALNDNKTYAVVWQVLQALRSHDDRFDAMVNKLDLIGKDTSKMEVIAITDKIHKKQDKSNGSKNKDAGKNSYTLGEPVKRPAKDDQGELQFEIGEIEKAIYAKLVQKVGNRHHWEDWANDIAKIARTHIDRIHAILENVDLTVERAAFSAFAAELRDDLNDSITDDEVVEMLAQHLITKPVFDALFDDYSFAKHNPMSLAMQGVLDVLQEHQLAKETDTLQSFYHSVKMRAEGINSATGKQKIVVELYDKFFRNAFPKMTERLGIVYTPIEVVDFIIHSVNDILKNEFDQTLASDNVHIIDPFTGTGTFITRLLQSGLISKDDLPKKYTNQIHANEIILLAYYIAAINIESVYHEIVGGEYQPFEGICLTDTFQLYEKEDLVDQISVSNSARRNKQKKLDIRVIIGNPPYSAGQKSENDNNQNVSYAGLDSRVRETYVARSSATLKTSLYDSYIKAIRWASDRLGNSGVIGFVTNAGFLESNSADGLRKCLAEEFSSVYVFHLRGNQRTSGELSRKEGGKIFGSGSRAPIAITLFVKNPNAKQYGKIYWHDIGDYLSQQEKLDRIKEFRSITGISDATGWLAIAPDEHGDWVNQRDNNFEKFIPIGDKAGQFNASIFDNYSGGVKTNRDAWVYDSARKTLEHRVAGMIDFYNQEVSKFSRYLKDGGSKDEINNVISSDSTKISWTDNIKADLTKGVIHSFEKNDFAHSLYRPFYKQWLYFNKNFNQRRYQIPKIFPAPGCANRVICITGLGESKGFTALATNIIPNLHVVAGSQCFPLYLYENSVGDTEEVKQSDMFVAGDLINQKESRLSNFNRKDGISDTGLAHFHTAYPGEIITKEDVFYYVYGLLHSPDYRNRYADNLTKELPRIPCVRTAMDFWTFSQAGRKLAEIHIDYESVPCHPVEYEGGPLLMSGLDDADFRVTQMKFFKKSDKSRVVYNHKITMTGIPLEAYEYVVNGKSALEWVMERYAVTSQKDSGIVNDANLWATETMDNARYPLELFQRIITVSLETMKIVRALPKLDILTHPSA
jgi:predicted helicase